MYSQAGLHPVKMLVRKYLVHVSGSTDTAAFPQWPGPNGC